MTNEQFHFYLDKMDDIAKRTLGTLLFREVESVTESTLSLLVAESLGRAIDNQNE